jgi:Family of unknown function (DUF6186)
MAAGRMAIGPSMSLRDTTIIGFVLIGCATMVLVVAGRLGLIARPVAVMDALLTRRTVRVLIVLAWLWLGWHFLVRTG